MIAIPTTLWVFQGTQAQDFWESIDGFAGVVPAHLDRDPMTGNVEPVWSGPSAKPGGDVSALRAA